MISWQMQALYTIKMACSRMKQNTDYNDYLQGLGLIFSAEINKTQTSEEYFERSNMQILHRIQKNTIYIGKTKSMMCQHVAKYNTSFKYQQTHTQNDHGKQLLTFFKQRHLSKYHHLSNIHFQKWEIEVNSTEWNEIKFLLNGGKSKFISLFKVLMVQITEYQFRHVNSALLFHIYLKIIPMICAYTVCI